MQLVIDLDKAAAILDRHAPAWRNRGLLVGPLTWADGQTFVHPVTTNRSEVRGDYSVGVKVEASGQEGHLILYAGGWCDLLFVSIVDETFIDEAPGWDDWLDLASFESVVKRFGALFAAGG